jgi:hypothetical protein
MDRRVNGVEYRTFKTEVRPERRSDKRRRRSGKESAVWFLFFYIAVSALIQSFGWWKDIEAWYGDLDTLHATVFILFIVGITIIGWRLLAFAIYNASDRVWRTQGGKSNEEY